MSQSRRYHLPQAFHLRYNGIDGQHAALIARANEIADIAVDGSLAEFEQGFEGFIDALQAHFASEEREMREQGYDGLGWHHLHHAKCLERIEAALARCREQGCADIASVDACFEGIVSDIAEADLKFGEFLDAKGLR